MSNVPVYRGISVEKKIVAYNPSTGESDTKALTSAASGTQVAPAAVAVAAVAAAVAAQR